MRCSLKYYKVEAYGDYRIYRSNPDLHFVQLMHWSIYNKKDRVWIDSPNPNIYAQKIEEITKQEAFLEIL